MVRTVLKWVLIAAIVIFVISWFLGGGIQKIVGLAQPATLSISDFVSGSSTLSSFHLPFAPAVPVAYVGGGGSTGAYQPYQSPSSLSNGAQSPYAGEVVMAQGAAVAQTPSGQYIEISATPGVSAIDVSGWTLQSSLTGALATLPQAASPFIAGKVNAVEDISLSGSNVAYITTGPSPVGVSFSENRCTGYLGTLQPFVPALAPSCPSPLTEIPDTPANESRLGSSCFTYLSQLPPCTFPANPPSGLSRACVAEIQAKLSYNGCLAAHEGDSGFFQNSWRLYLAQGRALWGAQHDVIRLLDRDGRVVDVLNY